MQAINLLKDHLSDECPLIHNARLQAVMDVASGLQDSKNLTLTSMARNLSGNISIKQKIKKVDRIEGNKHLHKELEALYGGLSSYVFKYLSYATSIPIIVDLCYIKDNKETQMLSAEVAVKGRSIPIYRDVFKSGELKGRAKVFLDNLKEILPKESSITVIMDAGFGEDWLKNIEYNNWHWITRIRQGKKIKITEEQGWVNVKDFFRDIGVRAKHYSNAHIMKKHNRSCRIVTKQNSTKNTKGNYKRRPRNYNAGNGDYQRSAKEPWVLATNLPEEYKTTDILNYYRKRMKIEESFRDVKSHQFGLGARYARTDCVNRWGVKLLLAAIVQIIYWILGVIGHSQNFQKVFQANTVKDKKIFSYFYLGRLIVEHNMIKDLKYDKKILPALIDEELQRKW